MNIKEKPYLLDPNVQDDDPLSIYKSFGQIISENYLSIFIIIGVLFLISFILYFLKKRGEFNPPINYTVEKYISITSVPEAGNAAALIVAMIFSSAVIAT